ncbi:DUF2336 domain-containing protein [Sphingomonas sp. CJ20]
MSDNPIDMRNGIAMGARELIARAAAADGRACKGLAVAIDDFFLPDDHRIDERTRSALRALLQSLVETVAAQIREHGARLLIGRGEPALGAALAAQGASVFQRLAQAGVLRDSVLMAEALGRVRQDALGAALPMHAPDDPDQPSLLSRFAEHPDRVLASGAMALLIAESRRRVGPDAGQAGTDLPAELHHKLVWWVAAALRARVAEGAGEGLAVLDRALCDAAQRSLAAYDEGDRLEAAALRFAAAIDAQASELPALLVESLGDRRIALFIALLAHAIGVDYALARDVVLDPAADRLWLALRALELPRDAIAQIGYALCEADARRDLERFADALDVIAAISGAEARDALAPLRLDADYRAALVALAQSAGSR